VGFPGGMAEWSKATVLKTVDRKVRGFESYSLRHKVRTMEFAPAERAGAPMRGGEVREWPKRAAC
jgi:hypothetical protein